MLQWKLPRVKNEGTFLPRDMEAQLGLAAQCLWLAAQCQQQTRGLILSRKKKDIQFGEDYIERDLSDGLVHKPNLSDEAVFCLLLLVDSIQRFLISRLRKTFRGQILGSMSRDRTGHKLHLSQMTQLHIIVDWSGCRRWTFLWLRRLPGLRLIQSSGAALKRMLSLRVISFQG